LDAIVSAASAHALCFFLFFFSSRRRHTRFSRDWSSDVCSSDLEAVGDLTQGQLIGGEEVLAQTQTDHQRAAAACGEQTIRLFRRSEERRVGKEYRSRWAPSH